MKFLVGLAVAAVMFPIVAHATGSEEVTVLARSDDRRIACYREIEMPPEYHVEEILVTPAVPYYYRRTTGIVELRETPAVYEERRTLVQEARIVLQEVACPRQ